MTKFKVQYQLLDDLDYFPFPKKWMSEDDYIEDTDDRDEKKKKVEIMNKKRLEMQEAIFEYSKWSKRNKKKRWPKALLEIEKLRSSIITYNNAEHNLRNFVNSKILSEYHVPKTYRGFRQRITGDKLIEMEKQILDFKSVKDIEEHTTLRTSMITEDISVNNLSFNS
jgi:hypothetical protein